MVVGLGITVALGPGPPAPPAPVDSPGTKGADQAFGAALYFLAHYELPDGRVVRWDQGADTVSEGQAYAMLLSVAAGDRQRFDAAWSWTRAHLLEPSGLLAWHWDTGHITGSEPAADADVDAAFALELAASEFVEPGDTAAAAAMASAIARDETVATPAGGVLVAGPWAVGPPAYANPSYASPAELATLGQLPGQGPSFAALAAGTRALADGVLSADALPPDWLLLTTGTPLAVGPSGSGEGDRYGFDAVRLPIHWAASCDPADGHAVAALWHTLGPRARRGRGTVDLGIRGGAGSTKGAVSSPVGLVAAAAAGWAAGHHTMALALLATAEAQNRAHPTYYSSAWVALGRVFLQTRRLGTCGG